MPEKQEKPGQQKAQPSSRAEPNAATEAKNQPHNAKKEALGPNTKR